VRILRAQIHRLGRAGGDVLILDDVRRAPAVLEAAIPLGPITATISPACTDRSTPLSACTLADS
jgi:hypothetical protein